MARGKTLGELITDLRAAVGLSTSSAVGQQNLDEMKSLLNRHQEALYENDWEFLKVYRDVTLFAGQRYYDFPSDLSEEGVADGGVSVIYNGQHIPVCYGIGTEQYNQLASDSTPPSVSFTLVDSVYTHLSAITINSVDVLGATLMLGSQTLEQFAAAIAAQINANFTTPEYTAASDGASVTITYDGPDPDSVAGKSVAFSAFTIA